MPTGLESWAGFSRETQRTMSNSRHTVGGRGIQTARSLPKDAKIKMNEAIIELQKSV